MFQRFTFWFCILTLLMVKASVHTASVKSFLTMNTPRAGHTATLLHNGNVLIAGGCIAQGCENQLTATAELFNPNHQEFIETGRMNAARVGHQAILVPSGDVYIFGGWAGSNATKVVEKYNPQTGTFELAGTMLESRDGFTATLLQDGRIFLAGGYNGNMKRLSSTEIYDPHTQISVASKAMSVPRMAHSASLLKDGQVLLVGGSQSRGQVLDTAEMFNPVTETLTKVRSMSTPRHKHAATMLDDGDVLIIGGAGAGDFNETHTSTERFNHHTLTFQNAAEMYGKRFKIPDAVTNLEDKRILVAGSHSQLEVYDISTDNFSRVSEGLGTELFYSTATKLENNQVLIAGGYNRDISVSNKTWLFTSQ